MEVDRSLLALARRLTTGANVHRINIQIICYEEAIRKQNLGAEYRSEFEETLRDFVKQAEIAKQS